MTTLTALSSFIGIVFVPVLGLVLYFSLWAIRQKRRMEVARRREQVSVVPEEARDTRPFVIPENDLNIQRSTFDNEGCILENREHRLEEERAT